MSVTLTDTAAREIQTIIKQQDLNPDAVKLRVGVKGGGCSGFSYILDLTESQRDTDEAWTFEFNLPVKTPASSKAAAGEGDEAGGVAVAAGDPSETATETFTLTVICDPKSLLYLESTTIDFKDEIMGRGFVFNNPNATTSCGCGSSFAV